MKEKQWLACTDPTPMLRFVRDTGNASDRKLRLFAVACYKHVSDLSCTDVEHEGAEVAECHADGRATDQELEEAHENLDSSGDYRYRPAHEATAIHQDLIQIARDTAQAAASLAGDAGLVGGSQGKSDSWELAEAAERQAQAGFLRDIIAPFRAVPSPVFTPMLIALASGIYEDRAFDRLSILADALEEAGCTDEAILTHCRGPGPHVRGCWVVDLLLGKE